MAGKNYRANKRPREASSERGLVHPNGEKNLQYGSPRRELRDERAATDKRQKVDDRYHQSRSAFGRDRTYGNQSGNQSRSSNRHGGHYADNRTPSVNSSTSRGQNPLPRPMAPATSITPHALSPPPQNPSTPATAAQEPAEQKLSEEEELALRKAQRQERLKRKRAEETATGDNVPIAPITTPVSAPCDSSASQSIANTDKIVSGDSAPALATSTTLPAQTKPMGSVATMDTFTMHDANTNGALDNAFAVPHLQPETPCRDLPTSTPPPATTAEPKVVDPVNIELATTDSANVELANVESANVRPSDAEAGNSQSTAFAPTENAESQNVEIASVAAENAESTNVKAATAKTDSTGSKKAESDDFDMFAEDIPESVTSASNTAEELYARARDLSSVAKEQWDDQDKHYKIVPHELLKKDNPRALQVISQLGKGTFAIVVKALVHPKPDRGQPEFVAVKIASSHETMSSAGRTELAIVEMLNEKDTRDMFNIVRLRSNFKHKGHLCLEFELLDADLRQTLKEPSRKGGFKIADVRNVARRMVSALYLLNKNSVVHGDVKPDNIFVRKAPAGNLIDCKLGDFGTARTIEYTERDVTLVSRFYRAPEIMLGTKPTFAVDMWALGCTLYELLTNEILFNGKDNHGMLAVIQEGRGKIPNRMINQGNAEDVSQHFSGNLGFYDQEGGPKLRSVQSRAPPHKDVAFRIKASFGPERLKQDEERGKLPELISLIEQCLVLDPNDRITPGQAAAKFFARQNEQPEVSAS